MQSPRSSGQRGRRANVKKVVEVEQRREPEYDTRSCFRLRLLPGGMATTGNPRKKRRNPVYQSAMGSTEDSLLKSVNATSSSLAWESFGGQGFPHDDQLAFDDDENDFWDNVEASQSAQQFNPGENNTGSQYRPISTLPPPESAPATSPISRLLQPPKPENRSERRRRAYENEKRQKGGVYEGELEPEGVRGQEAVATSAPSLPNLLPIRKFDDKVDVKPSLVSPGRKHAQTINGSKHVTLIDPHSQVPSTPERKPAGVTDLNFLSPQQGNRQGPMSPGRRRFLLTRNTTTPPKETRSFSNKHPPPQKQAEIQQHLQTPVPELRKTVSEESPVAITPETVQEQFSSSASGSSHEDIEVVHGVAPVTAPQSTRTQRQPFVRATHVQGDQGKRKLLQFDPNQKEETPLSPRSRPDDWSESTESDEELRQMQSDLIPHENNHGNDKDSKASFDGELSPIAAAAAAAAALSYEHSPRRLESTSSSWPANPHILEEESVDDLNQRAMSDVATGDFETAIRRFARVLFLQKQAHGDIHPTVASAYHNLGTVHAKRAASLPDESATQRAGRTAALEAFQAAARTARDSLSPHHPNVAVSLVRIGFLLLQSKQYNNAVVTFVEALRIRKRCYGPRHALVANLYNNLGVCQMHLGEFEKGMEALQAALSIQRDIVRQAQKEKQRNQFTHFLELADTLFNIGGLCLEWIRRQGPDLRRTRDAEQSFEESLRIRMDVLGPNDPLVIQVRDLLELAKSIPRPKITSRFDGTPRSPRGDEEPRSPNSGVNRSLHSTGTLSPGAARRKQSHVNSLNSSLTSPGSQNSFGVSDTNSQDDFRNNSYSLSSSSPQHLLSSKGNNPESPSRPKTTSPGDDGLPLPRHLAPSVTGPSSFETFSPSKKKDDESFNSRLETQLSPRKGALDSLPLPSLSHQSHAHSEHTSPTGVSGGTGSAQQLSNVHAGSSQVFLFDKPPRPDNKKKRGTDTGPPVVEVTVAKDNEEPKVKVVSPTQRTRKVHLPDESFETINYRSVDETIHPDTSTEAENLDVPKLAPYDNEENCLLSDSGVDSEHGRIHFPLTWNKAGLTMTEYSESARKRERDIVVSRPFRKNEFGMVVRNGQSPESSKSSSDIDTGNKERDEVMRRARAILQLHDVGDVIGLSRTRSRDDESRSTQGKNRPVVKSDDVTEDGLADLGGEWKSHSSKNSFHTVGQMMMDPMSFLPEIHEEACQMLQRDEASDSIPLFLTILQCQKKKNGAIHKDVASALHNYGIALLRSKHVEDALKAFEESARIRRGVLGREHPDVAVSLVKVGITLLLLHRFEEALWSFREALSVRKISLGTLHPSTARIYNNIGCVHVEFNELREARKAFEDGLDIQRGALTNDPDNASLMLATATTLCNLGYLYRYRDLHGKASMVLKEAVDLQESVLGRSSSTVLSTLDTLADSCATSGQTSDALRYYNMILTRYRAGGRIGSQKVLRAEAILLYKMSRVHRQRNDHESQLDTLTLALRSVHSLEEPPSTGKKNTTLERRIMYDIRACQDIIDKNNLKWI